MPLALIDCESSASFSESKVRRGWSGFGSIASTETKVGSSLFADSSSGSGGGAGACVREERRAFRPLPSTFRGFSLLFMVQNLFRKLDIALGAFGARIVPKDGLTKTRRFSQSNTSWDDGLENLIPKE